MAGRSKRAPQLPTTIDDLPDAALLDVFAAVPPSFRRRLPLVCRRWAALCSGPSAVWEDVHVDFSHGIVEDSSAMYRWLLQRRGAIQGLTLVCETDEDWMSVHLVLGLLASGLRRLAVRPGREGLGMHSVAWLAVLRQLRSLDLAYEDESLIRACAVLPPSLEELRLRPCRCSALRCLPPGLLKLTALRSLSLRSVDFSTTPPALAAMAGYESDGDGQGGGAGNNKLAPLCRLTALERLTIASSQLPPLPARFSALSCLTHLALPDCSDTDLFADHNPAALAPLAALSQLASLNLSGCSLAELPPPVAALPKLRTLLLADNCLTSVPDGPYLAGLEHLDLRLNDLAMVPPALVEGCSCLEWLDLSSRHGQRRLRFAARDLRQLLAANPGLRQLAISSEAGIAASQLAQLRSSFPKVRVLEVEPDAGGAGGSGGEGSGDSDFLLGSDDEETEDSDELFTESEEEVEEYGDEYEEEHSDFSSGSSDEEGAAGSAGEDE